MRFWPFGSKKNQPQNSYTGDISLERAVDLITREMGTVPAVTGSGQPVNEQTALNFSAVYACVSLLSGTIASLPFEVYRSAGDESELASDHPAHRLINSAPNDALTAYVFWETIGFDHFLSGNAYGLIARKQSGDPKAVYWIPHKSIEPFFNPDKTRIWYRLFMPGKETMTFDQDDILHFPCMGWDGLKGKSPIACARESVGLGLAGENYNAKFFTNAISSNIGITYPNEMSETAEKKLVDYLKSRYSGADNQRNPLVLTNGGDVKNLQMNAEDAQMMASRVFQIEDICRFYGVPLHLVSSTEKSTSWGTGIEHQTIGFVRFTLRRRVKMIEQEVNRKLIRDPGYFCKFNLEALLRGDVAARGGFYNIMRGGNQLPGIMSINEIRKRENLKPLPDPKYDQPYDPGTANKGGDTNNENQSNL